MIYLYNNDVKKELNIYSKTTMRLRSGRVIQATNNSNSDSDSNSHLRKLYFDYSDSESEINYSDDDYDSEYNNEYADYSEKYDYEDNNGDCVNHTNVSAEPSLPQKPYQVNIMNRIRTFMDVKHKFLGSYPYYIELARAITELYASMNIYFDDWIYDMYNDSDYSTRAYKVLTIANDKARSFIVRLMHELTTSTNPMYNKQKNIKIIHAALNEMREFVNRVEEHILAEDTKKY